MISHRVMLHTSGYSAVLVSDNALEPQFICVVGQPCPASICLGQPGGRDLSLVLLEA